MGALLSMFGGGGGGGLSVPISTSSSAGPAVSSTGNQTSTGAGISVLSPAAGNAMSLGGTGIIIIALVALVGVVILIREF
jgi:hypothetical protein